MIPTGVDGWNGGDYDPHLVRGDVCNTTILHVQYIESIPQIRADLRLAADYIQLHPELYKRRHVLGVTYRELAQVAERIGFSRITLHNVHEDYAANVRAHHAALPPLPGGRPREFELAMVCLPTAAFTARFATPSIPGRHRPNWD